MRKLNIFAAALLLLLLPAGLLAQAKATVVHGISGGALGLPSDLPVDVWVNGAPFLTDFTFTTIAGPVELPAGEYDIQVFLAGSDPAVEDPVLTLQATLADGDDVAIVAHLVAGPGIALTPFVNNNTPVVDDPITPRISTRNTRVTVRHTAEFPRVAINRLVPVLEPTLANGQELSIDVDPGHYSFWLSRAGARRTLSFDPIAVDLAGDTHYFVYAVGSPRDRSFQLIIGTDTLD